MNNVSETIAKMVQSLPESLQVIVLEELLPESCTKYRSEAPKALCFKRSWSDFDPQAYYLYGEDQNLETSFKGKALQAVVDSWCKIQVDTVLLEFMKVIQ